MGVNIAGISGAAQPNVFTRVRTKERVNAVSGGSRIVCVMGEGESEEQLIISANGSGNDGENSDFSGSNSPDGRHFQMSRIGLVENRNTVYKNGIPLATLEDTISILPFDSRYDARIEIATGRIELQNAHLEDFGTDANGNTLWFETIATNTGNGRLSITSAGLVDTNAPEETWSIRCVANVKDGSGDAIPGEATFTVSGSTSGQLKDGYGEYITVKSDGVAVNNGILSFAVLGGSVPYEVGDRFNVKVNSGVLKVNDSLSVRFISAADVNDPETFFTPSDLFEKHGQPSAENSLSLGAQIAFENGAPRVTAIQAKPPVPRKTSEFLISADDLLTGATEGASGSADLDDTIFPLAAAPDVDTTVNVFVTSPDGSEEQLVLNKEAFYTYTTTASAFTGFVGGPTGSAYTVFSAPQVEQSGDDGYTESLSDTEIFFSAPGALFEADRQESGEGDVGKQIIILEPATLLGTYTITTIGDGYGNVNEVLATITTGSIPGGEGIIDQLTVKYQVVDPNETSAYFAVTDDVATGNLISGKGLRVSYVDTKDADYFDTNWGEALSSAEEVDVQIIVPLPSATVSNIFQATKIHVESMSNIINQKERIMVVGAITGLTPDNLTGRSTAAVENIGVLEGIQGDSPEEVLAGEIEDLANYSVPAAFGDSFRSIYMWPDQIVRNINGQNTFLPGYYQAAALGGHLAGQTNVAEPVTFKTLTGYNILRDRVARNITKNELAGAGVLVVEPIAGGGRMLHGLTTTTSQSPEEEEISVVGIRDQVAKAVRTALAPFIGRTQSPTVVPALSQGIAKLLRSLVGQGLLAGFGQINVSRDPIEPRQINLSLEINPRGPTNWIFVDMTVSL